MLDKIKNYFYFLISQLKQFYYDTKIRIFILNHFSPLFSMVQIFFSLTIITVTLNNIHTSVSFYVKLYILS